MFDKGKALENAYRKLQRQQETLKATLAELAYIQANRPELGNAIANLRTKRDRQAIAVKATEQLIDFYGQPDPNQLDLVESKGKKR